MTITANDDDDITLHHSLFNKFLGHLRLMSRFNRFLWFGGVHKTHTSAERVGSTKGMYLGIAYTPYHNNEFDKPRSAHEVYEVIFLYRSIPKCLRFTISQFLSVRIEEPRPTFSPKRKTAWRCASNLITRRRNVINCLIFCIKSIAITVCFINILLAEREGSPFSHRLRSRWHIVAIYAAHTKRKHTSIDIIFNLIFLHVFLSLAASLRSP